MAKFREKIQARKLRGKGESIKSIARKLKVSPGTVSIWCRDVQLTQSQIRELERRGKDPNYGRRLEYTRRRRLEKEEKIKKLRQEGINEIGELTERELFLVGASLYWAEGFKKDSQAGFASSDPKMIVIILKWLKDCGYSLNDLTLRVTVNISHIKRIDDIQKYWSEVTGISVGNFQKPFYQKFKWKKVYENPEDYHGVLRVRVRKSTDFLRKIHGWIEGLGLQGEI